VNDEEMASTHVFDLKTLKVLATWPLAPGEGGTGMAVDRAHHRIFATCANDKLVVLDSDTGKVVATPAIGEDPDAVHFDVATQTLYVSCLDSTMTVIHEDSPDRYSLVQTVATGPGAKTSALDNGKNLPAGDAVRHPAAADQGQARAQAPGHSGHLGSHCRGKVNRLPAALPLMRWQRVVPGGNPARSHNLFQNLRSTGP